MGNVTHAQVQELVNSLPETKLSLAFQILQNLAERDAESLSQDDLSRSSRVAFGDSSLEERRKLLSQQAERMKAYYEESGDERAEWQAGDFK